MGTYKTVLFDLDGTLTESGEGITKSVQYALERFGIHVQDLDSLRCFIGPPLLETFMRYGGFDRENAEKAISYYRERYTKIGIFENELYPGIRELLEHLKKAGKQLAIASSKPEPFVRRIMD